MLSNPPRNRRIGRFSKLITGVQFVFLSCLVTAIDAFGNYVPYRLCTASCSIGSQKE
jgi:hypothetical protein